VSTIGYERKYNAALQHATQAEFKQALLAGMPEAPDHFARCSAINRRGPALVAELANPRPLSPRDARELVGQGHIVVDARDYSSFGGAHIPGAYNIDGAHNFPTFCGWILPPDRPIILVAQTDEQIPMLTAMLRRVGLDNVVGYLENGMNPWIVAGLPVDHVPTITVQEVHDQCRAERTPLTLLDVRALGEWNAAHIDGAVHMPLPATRTRYAELPAEATIALVCKSGARASTAGSILRQHGMRNLAVMAGGMTAWVAAGYAPECPMCSLTHGPRFRA